MNLGIDILDSKSLQETMRDDDDDDDDRCLRSGRFAFVTAVRSSARFLRRLRFSVGCVRRLTGEGKRLAEVDPFMEAGSVKESVNAPKDGSRKSEQ